MQYTTAIVIMAPPQVQALAVPLLRQHRQETIPRVPAHVTVLFPFVPLDHLDDASRKLCDLFADVPPFEITLAEYGHFPTTIYLKPADSQPIKALFQRVHAAFPEYPPYRGAFGTDDITPHLTVAEFEGEAERAAVPLPPFEPVTFRVRRLHLIAGVEHEPIPWITYDVIPLKGAL
jgi:2'-5' RNA ligase